MTTKNKSNFLIGALVSLLFLLFYVYLNPSAENKQVIKPLPVYADEIVKECQNISYRPTCYEDKVPRLMDVISMEQAFDVIRMIQQKDPSYAYCHVLAHKISGKETAKDPNRWKEVITRSPAGLCSNGAIHGAFQERFRAESLTDQQIEQVKPELVDVCEPRGNWHPTGLQQGTCYHALGHLVMYVTNAGINKSLQLCNDLANNGRDFRQLCYDGAFMQIFQPLEPEDFALIEGKVPKKDKLDDFCQEFSGQQQGSCWSEGWPLYREEILKPRGLVNYCTKPFLSQTEQTRCFTSLFYVITAQVQFDLDFMKSFCNDLSGNSKKLCFANVSSRLIETDFRNIEKSVEVCNSAKKAEVENACFEELLKYSTYNFQIGSPEFYNLCNQLPPQWRDQCLASLNR